MRYRKTAVEMLMTFVFATVIYAQPQSGLAEELLRHSHSAPIAELEKKFEVVADPIEKQKIAATIVAARLKNDDRYFDFLASLAQKAVRSDMPFPLAYDMEGKVMADRPSNEFLAWAYARKVDPVVATIQAVQEFPIDILFLGLTNDPRAVELLEEGLSSKNPLVVYQAALGLARLQKEAAVPSIIAVAEQAPQEAGQLIAEALLLFSSDKAQAAAERLVGDEKVIKMLRARSKELLARSIADF